MSALWHYIQNGKSQGPVPEEQLRGLMASGVVRPADLVWREGMADWTAIQSVPELASVSSPIQLADPIQLNPYVAPQANVAAPIQAAIQAPGAVSADAVEHLRRTKPWVRFMGVLGAIMMGFMVLFGLAMAVVGGGFFHYFGGLPARIGMAALYIVLALLYLPPVIYLNRYASRIGDLLSDNSPQSLEEALLAQKSFWKYIGLFTLIVMCIYLVVIIGVVVTGLVVGMGRFR
jgi:hypothetical protein